MRPARIKHELVGQVESDVIGTPMENIDNRPTSERGIGRQGWSSTARLQSDLNLRFAISIPQQTMVLRP